MTIEIQGQQELLRNLSKFQREAVGSAMDRGLKSAGLQIVADAKTNLRDNTSVVTGHLRASGRVQSVGAGSYEVGFFGENKGYAEYVENGRRAGKMPPVDEIMQWVRKKNSGNRALSSAAVFVGKKQTDFVRSLAWATAKSIARHGTKPHPFFAPAVKKNQRKIMSVITDAINKTIKEYSK